MQFFVMIWEALNKSTENTEAHGRELSVGMTLSVSVSPSVRFRVFRGHSIRFIQYILKVSEELLFAVADTPGAFERVEWVKCYRKHDECYWQGKKISYKQRSCSCKSVRRCCE